MGPVGCPETSVRDTTTRCVISQKSAVLIYFAGKPEIAQQVELYQKQIVPDFVSPSV